MGASPSTAPCGTLRHPSPRRAGGSATGMIAPLSSPVGSGSFGFGKVDQIARSYFLHVLICRFTVRVDSTGVLYRGPVVAQCEVGAKFKAWPFSTDQDRKIADFFLRK